MSTRDIIGNPHAYVKQKTHIVSLSNMTHLVTQEGVMLSTCCIINNISFINMIQMSYNQDFSRKWLISI